MLNHLQALTMGTAIPQTFTATIHSVFRSALNLHLTNTPYLITLLSADQPDLPQGIRLATPPDFSFERFRPGEAATCAARLLRFASWTIDLRGASPWESNLSAASANLDIPAILAAWQTTWQLLNERQHRLQTAIVAEELLEVRPSSPNNLRTAIAMPLHNLLAATQRYDLPAAMTSLRPLIGLGPGLTPSGDDLLVGYLTGLWCLAQNDSQRIAFVRSLGNAIHSLANQTNEISRTYLFHAGRGQVSSTLTALAQAICHGKDQDQLLPLFTAAAKSGHSSGTDAITGLLFGLLVWIDSGENQRPYSRFIPSSAPDR